MEAVIRRKDATVVAINGAGKGFMCVDSDEYNVIPIPDQSVDWAYDDEGEFTPFVFPGDLVTYDDGASLLIDKATGEAIDEAVHPFAGIDESIGTIRDMVVQIINAIGLAPTADFARLNDIAIAAIKEAAVKKAKL